MSAETTLIRRTIAAVYRQQAGWTDDSRAQREFRGLAEQVEALDGTETCCPCCQEITCDAGCPLEPVRSAAETASAGVPVTPEEFGEFTRKHGVRWEEQ